MTRKWVVILIVLVAGAVAETAQANHYFGWHWWQANTTQRVRPYVIDHSFPEHGFRGSGGPLAVALTSWRDRTVRLDAAYIEADAAFTQYCGVGSPAPPYPEIWVCSEINPGASYYGYFQPYGVDASEHLVSGKIVFNVYGLDPSNRRSLACHEAGHAYGLYHPNNGATCMSQTTWNVNPSSFDVDEVDNHIYDAPDGHPGHDPYSGPCHYQPCDGVPMALPLGRIYLYRWPLETLDARPQDVVLLP